MGSSSFIKEVGRFELLPLEIQLAKAAAPGMVAARRHPDKFLVNSFRNDLSLLNAVRLFLDWVIRIQENGTY